MQYTLPCRGLLSLKLRLASWNTMRIIHHWIMPENRAFILNWHDWIELVMESPLITIHSYSWFKYISIRMLFKTKHNVMPSSNSWSSWEKKTTITIHFCSNKVLWQFEMTTWFESQLFHFLEFFSLCFYLLITTYILKHLLSPYPMFWPLWVHI